MDLTSWQRPRRWKPALWRHFWCTWPPPWSLCSLLPSHLRTQTGWSFSAISKATLVSVTMALMYEIKWRRDPCEISSSPPNSPLPMVCRSFSSLLFKAQPPANRGQITLSRLHSQRQSRYKSDNITVNQPGESMHYKRQNVDFKEPDLLNYSGNVSTYSLVGFTYYISSGHIYLLSERCIWEEKCWFMRTFNFSQFSGVRISWVRQVHEEEWRETEVEDSDWPWELVKPSSRPQTQRLITLCWLMLLGLGW